MSDLLSKREEELESLQYRIEAVKERAKQVKQKEQKKLFKENIKTLKITENGLEDELKLLKKALRILQENKSKTDPEKLKVLNQVALIETEIEDNKHSSKEEKVEIQLDHVKVDTRNVYTDPPKDACEVVFNGIDAATDKTKKELARDFLFGYSHPKLKSHFKDRDFLECDAKMVELNKKKYIWLYITISSKDAMKNYGYIANNSPLKFELLNGEILYAASAQNAMGKLEPYTGNTKYEVILPLDKSKYKLLSKSEIDRIGIMWTSGYEQYEVYNVDVIMKQIDCLENL